jgi:hypothetical protein
MPLEQIKKLWAELDRAGREAHLKWTLKHCATCGRDRAVNGFWCNACIGDLRLTKRRSAPGFSRAGLFGPRRNHVEHA